MTKQRVQEIVGQFGDKRILVIGDVVLDRYVRGVVERLNPEAPVPILAVTTETEQTGGAGNVAKNLAALDAQATLISVVGADSFAARVAQAVKQERYTLDAVRDESRPTIRKIRYLVGSQQMLRVDYERVADVEGKVEEEIIAKIKMAAAKKVDGILVSDYAKGVVTEKIAQAIVGVARDHSISVAADVKPSRAPYFIGITCISPNVKEAHEMLGLNQYERGGKSPSELARALRDKMQCDVFLTLGADGVFVSTRAGEEAHVSQDHVVEVFDVSGAGDTSAAVMLLARLAGATAREAAQLANAAGAVVVGKVGSVGLSQSELLDMIAETHG
jgi:D-glycero-beta-D-manno-heptose-7-phosphate kinase